MKELLLGCKRIKEKKILIAIPIIYIIVSNWVVNGAVKFIQVYNYPVFPQVFRIVMYALLIEICIAGMILSLKILGGFYREKGKEKGLI